MSHCILLCSELMTRPLAIALQVSETPEHNSYPVAFHFSNCHHSLCFSGPAWWGRVFLVCQPTHWKGLESSYLHPRSAPFMALVPRRACFLVSRPHFLYPFTCDGHLHCYHNLSTENYIVINMETYVVYNMMTQYLSERHSKKV